MKKTNKKMTIVDTKYIWSGPTKPTKTIRTMKKTNIREKIAILLFQNNGWTGPYDADEPIIGSIIKIFLDSLPKEKRGSGDAEEHQVAFGSVMGFNTSLSEIKERLGK